jgi:sugar transferase EpsL
MNLAQANLNTDNHPRRLIMYHAAKRAFDIIAAIAFGLAAAPFAAVLAPLLWQAQGSVLFRQLRPGLHGKPFMLYKFCSMNSARDEQGQLLPDDQRLTRIGRFVRSLSLDELPQLWNVLRGDMSLVGPRPLLIEYLDLYSHEQARRHDVKPGITGWAQVNGRNTLDWKDKFALDVWYVDHASFSLDLKILWYTFPLVARRAGIGREGRATIEKFMGNDIDAC